MEVNEKQVVYVSPNAKYGSGHAFHFKMGCYGGIKPLTVAEAKSWSLKYHDKCYFQFLKDQEATSRLSN